MSEKIHSFEEINFAGGKSFCFVVNSMSCIRTGGGSFFYEQSKVKLQDRATGSKK